MLIWLAALGCNDPGSLTINNTDPTASIDAPADGSVLSAGLPVLLEGTVGDAETPEAELIVQWRVDGEVACEDPPDAFGETTCEVQLPSGEVDIVLQVADGSGGIAEDAIALSATRCFDDEDTLDDLGYSQAFGTLDSSDLAVDERLQDNFAFEATAGLDLAFHAWSEAFDAELELYGPTCERIASADGGGRGTNAFLALRIPADGTYTAVVRAPAAASGDYVLELIDDSVEVGAGCSLGSSFFDLWQDPWTDTLTGELTTSDQAFPPSVGTNHYYDDVEVWMLYGDRLDVTMSSTAFVPALNLYRFDHGTGGCGLVTYDGNDDEDDTAALGVDITESGIFVATAWARYGNSTGAWTMTATASF